MIHCGRGVTIKKQVSSQDLLDRMKLDDMQKVPLTRRLRWHNHVESSDSWLKNVLKLNPVGGRDSGRPKKIWSEVIRQDCLSSSLTETHPSEGNLRGVHLEVCRHAGPYCSEIRARYHPNPTPDRWPLESLPLGSETGIQVTAVVGIGDHLGAATSGFSPGPRFCCFRRHHTPPHQILKT